MVLYPAGSVADRRGRKTVMVPALSALAVTTAVVGTVGTVPALFVAMAFLGVASGFAGVPPAAMLSDVVPEESSGTGVGAFRFTGDLSFFLGPLVAGWSINTFGFRPAFAVAAIPSAIALVFVLRTPETMPRPAPDGEV
ncbi:MAG TPA: MFS transporter [Actinomycetota bacterium]|nr:MFS transporter [Actinomycetota bacterium]